ncbi:MAG: Tll0287-like domain-containing protein [Nitrospiraceae bacterium]
MKSEKGCHAALISVLIGLSLITAAAFANSEAVETGRLLAVLLDAGRMVVAENQSLINDPKKANKGFTPDVFELQVIDRFKERVSIDLANLKNERVPEKTKKLLHALAQVEKMVVSDVQRIINMEGIGYKGFTPTVFAASAVSKLRAYADVSVRQTMKSPRNPRNAPDPFEAKALEKFADPKYPRQGEAIVSEVVDGGNSVRVVLPLYYAKSCLACHGEPKGAKDVTGYMKEGRKEGDLGGAISVKLDAK